jgi:predicted Zn-dependent protease
MPVGWNGRLRLRPEVRLFFSLGNEIYKRRLWKEASHSIGGSTGGNLKGGYFT